MVLCYASSRKLAHTLCTNNCLAHKSFSTQMCWTKLNYPGRMFFSVGEGDHTQVEAQWVVILLRNSNDIEEFHPNQSLWSQAMKSLWGKWFWELIITVGSDFNEYYQHNWIFIDLPSLATYSHQLEKVFFFIPTIQIFLNDLPMFSVCS